MVSEDFAKFEDLDKEMIEVLDDWMDQGIATVAKNENKKGPDGSQEVVSGGAFDGVMDSKSSFLTYPNIISEEDEKEAMSLFQTLKVREDGKLDGNRVKNEMLKSSLPKHVLQRIWKLSDVDGDSMLTLEEYKVVRFLIRRMLAGNDLPTSLPSQFFPKYEAERLEKERLNAKKEL